MLYTFKLFPEPEYRAVSVFKDSPKDVGGCVPNRYTIKPIEQIT